MKKIITVSIAIMMLLSFTACSEKSVLSSDGEQKSTQSEIENSEEKTTEESEDEERTADVKADKKEDAGEISFTEITVVDNDECVIKITGIDPDNMWGFTLNAQCENKSADKTYMFCVDSAAINGVQCDPFFAAEIAAGKKSNDDISFSGDELEENNIGEYTDIELTFRVYDSNDWEADPVALETVHVYPYGEDKAVKFIRESQDSDTIIIDNEYVTAIVTGYEEDDILGYSVNLFLINKTDKNVMFSADEVSVNGFMADPFYATCVSAGNCKFSSMSWSDTTFEENNITDVEEIELKLRVYDEDDWSSDDFANETVTLNP